MATRLKLTPLTIMTNMKLASSSTNPTNIFQYLEGRLNSLVKPDRLAYAVFDSQTHWRRRDPNSNDTIHNIELPRFGLAPSIGYRMVGSSAHLDTSLLSLLIKQGTGFSQWYTTSGLYWVNSKEVNYIGHQIKFTNISSTQKRELTDPRYWEFFW